MNRTNNAEMEFTTNHLPPSDDKWLKVMDVENVRSALRFHRSFPQYEVTPLQSLKKMASYLGLKGLYVKDESYRFGLNAFKVLGGSYAIGSYIAKKTGKSIDELPYEVLSSDRFREEMGQTTFYTATDGNHGRGVAWSAHKLGQKAVVRMPRGSAATRRDNIAKEGAEVTIEDLNYDECVRLAAAQAKEDPDGVIVQDTAWMQQVWRGRPTSSCRPVSAPWLLLSSGILPTSSATMNRSCASVKPVRLPACTGQR